MKDYIIIILLFGFNLASCQNLNKERMIEKFIVDQFNDKIPASSVVEKYLEINPDSLNKVTLTNRKKLASEIILKARNNEGYSSWLIPNYEIKNIKKPKVYLLKKFKNLDSLGIASLTKYENHIYVLLDSNKEKILQYFLLNEVKNKIISFSLFIKSDNLAWFFSF